MFVLIGSLPGEEQVCLGKLKTKLYIQRSISNAITQKGTGFGISPYGGRQRFKNNEGLFLLSHFR